MVKSIETSFSYAFPWMKINFDSWNLIKKFPNGPTKIMSSLVRVMALRRRGDNRLLEPVMMQLIDAYMRLLASTDTLSHHDAYITAITSSAQTHYILTFISFTLIGSKKESMAFCEGFTKRHIFFNDCKFYGDVSPGQDVRSNKQKQPTKWMKLDKSTNCSKVLMKVLNTCTYLRL